MFISAKKTLVIVRVFKISVGFPCLNTSGMPEVMRMYLCAKQHLHISYLKPALPFPLFISGSQRDILSFHLLPTPFNSSLSFSSWLVHKSLHPSLCDLATYCLVLMSISGHWGHSLLHPTNKNTHTHTLSLVNTERMICAAFPHRHRT